MGGAIWRFGKKVNPVGVPDELLAVAFELGFLGSRAYWITTPTRTKHELSSIADLITPLLIHVALRAHHRARAG